MSAGIVRGNPRTAGHQLGLEALPRRHREARFVEQFVEEARMTFEGRDDAFSAGEAQQQLERLRPLDQSVR